MGAIGGLLGMGGGAGGTGFNTPSGTTAAQLQNAYQGNQAAMGGQNALLNALQAQQGLQNQSNVYGQLQNVAQGRGPNPAQAMLNQATGANVANQAALMAGQRGAGANAGLMARQAAQQGANLQQQAAGQGASMQAQQALGALGQAGGMANQMAGQQIGQVNQNVASQQGEQGILQGANTANNQIQGTLANTTLGGQQSMVGGLMNSAGAGLKMLAGANGGEVPYASGGMAGPQSMFGQSVNSQNAAAAQGQNFNMASTEDQKALQKGAQNLGSGLLSALQSSPKKTMTAGPDMGAGSVPSGTMVAAQGGNVGAQLKQGGHVPGQAKVKGDSLKNDNVKALLSPGEVVIPRSVMQSHDPVGGAASFVQAVMAKKKAKA